MMADKGRILNICHLYPDMLNLYGDRGNILCMKRRLEWRGIECTVTSVRLGESARLSQFDLFFIGGGQDFEQEVLMEDLRLNKAADLAAAAADGKTFLCICGGYQLMGHSYRTVQGNELGYLGISDFYTVAAPERMIGNIVFALDEGSAHGGATHGAVSAQGTSGVSSVHGSPGAESSQGTPSSEGTRGTPGAESALGEGSESGAAEGGANAVMGERGATAGGSGAGCQVVGFENHAGRTFLGEGVRPLGHVVKGFGNNGQDGTEGLRDRNIFGTYCHGPVLPKNPRLADLILQTALERKYGAFELEPLDDAEERNACDEAIAQALKQHLYQGDSY